jgi:tryptophan synthase alpha chain
MRGIYLVAGYPDRDTFFNCVHAVAQAGFDFIEVGIPFNDPMADGPVIAKAIHDSLDKGATPERVLGDILFMKKVKIKKYAMTYANIVYSYGIKRFSGLMSGLLDGVIIPDLPNRMARLFYDEGFGMPVVPFATLETRLSDLDSINRSGSEIIYFVGVRGITGSAGNLESPELLQKIRMIKENTNKKIIIGFGIKTRDDAAKALRIGDGFVVGTEAVKRQKNPEVLKEYLLSLT